MVWITDTVIAAQGVSGVEAATTGKPSAHRLLELVDGFGVASRREHTDQGLDRRLSGGFGNGAHAGKRANIAHEPFQSMQTVVEKHIALPILGEQLPAKSENPIRNGVSEGPPRSHGDSLFGGCGLGAIRPDQVVAGGSRIHHALSVPTSPPALPARGGPFLGALAAIEGARFRTPLDEDARGSVSVRDRRSRSAEGGWGRGKHRAEAAILDHRAKWLVERAHPRGQARCVGMRPGAHAVASTGVRREEFGVAHGALARRAHDFTPRQIASFPARDAGMCSSRKKPVGWAMPSGTATCTSSYPDLRST